MLFDLRAWIETAKAMLLFSLWPGGCLLVLFVQSEFVYA
jgi:hypothetical protein